MSQDIDQRIKKAQRKGIGVYLVSGIVTGSAVVGFILWLFFIKTYTIIVGPQEAQAVAKINALSSFTYVHGNKIFTMGTTVDIEVSADTFQTAKVILDNNTPARVEVILLPSPATLSVSLLIDQNTKQNSNKVPSLDRSMQRYLDDTQWFLNGQLINVGNTFQHATAPGAYQLTAQNPYFNSTPIQLSLARAENKKMEIPLTPATGSLTMDSVPAGASVNINGSQIGITPIQIELETGDYKVAVEKSGMQPVQEMIPIKVKFLDQKRNYNLEPVQARLNVSARPKDGILLINNIEYPLGEVSLDANKTHSIEYSKPGYSTFSKKLNLSEQQDNAIDIEISQTFGELQLAANIPANVKLNGKPLGSVPLTLSLNTVPQTFEFSYQGYRSVQTTVTPKAAQSLQVKVSLLTEFEARRKEGKPLFVEQLGINMLRFSGTSFVMGSPVNETGRRRNEHQVEVDFSRQFWISNKEITRSQFSVYSGIKVDKSSLPMTEVSWIEAASFCNWLSEKEGLPEFYRFNNGRYVGINQKSTGYRLPTEAEWEWLAKKSRRTSSTLYVWGNQTQLRNNQGNFADKSTQGSQPIFFDDYEDGYSGLAPVASYKADRSGIFDLDGNVSEWVHDFYTTSIPDTSKVYNDYMGATSGETWVVKGGNFETGRLRDLRAAFREFSSRGSKNIGFRIARYHN